jgi:hypothetical protein
MTVITEKWERVGNVYADRMTLLLKKHSLEEKAASKNGRELLDKNERIVVDAFECHYEVHWALNTLELILQLASRKPSSGGVEPMDALRFYTEAYLEQMYVLRERIVRWIRFERNLCRPLRKIGVL